MKTKLPYILLLVAGLVLATAFSGNIVALGETYLSVDAETGDVYRVRERSRAYCDGTVVTRFRARRVSDCDNASSSCDRADAGGCSGSYGSQGGYGRGPRFYRGVRVHSFGSAGGYGSCDSGDSGSCAN